VQKISAGDRGFCDSEIVYVVLWVMRLYILVCG